MTDSEKPHRHFPLVVTSDAGNVVSIEEVDGKFVLHGREFMDEGVQVFLELVAEKLLQKHHPTLLEADNMRLQAEVERLEAELCRVSSMCDGSIDRLTAENARLQASLNSALDDWREGDQKNIRLTVENARLREQLAEMRSAGQSLRDCLDRLIFGELIVAADPSILLRDNHDRDLLRQRVSQKEAASRAQLAAFRDQVLADLKGA